MLDYHKYLALQSNLLSEFVMCYLWILSSGKKKIWMFSWYKKIIPLHWNLWFAVNLLFLQRMGKKIEMLQRWALFIFLMKGCIIYFLYGCCSCQGESLSSAPLWETQYPFLWHWVPQRGQCWLTACHYDVLFHLCYGEN